MLLMTEQTILLYYFLLEIEFLQMTTIFNVLSCALTNFPNEIIIHSGRDELLHDFVN